MKTKEKKSIQYYMRSLHRDVGFFALGLTFIYAISGIVLIYRDTGFLKSERQIERQLSPNIQESELGMMLHIRDFKITKTEHDIVYFKNGTYNKATGIVHYTNQALPLTLDKLISLHKSSSKNFSHWFTTIYGIALLFLAVSSFWMFKPNTGLFKRGLLFTGIGFIIAFILFFL